MDLLQDRSAEVAYYALRAANQANPRAPEICRHTSRPLEPRYNRELRCCSYRDQSFVGELPRPC